MSPPVLPGSFGQGGGGSMSRHSPVHAGPSSADGTHDRLHGRPPAVRQCPGPEQPIESAVPAQVPVQVQPSVPVQAQQEDSEDPHALAAAEWVKSAGRPTAAAARNTVVNSAERVVIVGASLPGLHPGPGRGVQVARGGVGDHEPRPVGGIPHVRRVEGTVAGARGMTESCARGHGKNERVLRLVVSSTCYHHQSPHRIPADRPAGGPPRGAERPFRQENPGCYGSCCTGPVISPGRAEELWAPADAAAICWPIRLPLG